MSKETRELDRKRALLEEARRQAANARLDSRDATRALSVLRRLPAQQVREQTRAEEGKREAAGRAVSETRRRARAAREALHAGLRAYLDVTPEAEVARLDANLPIVLL